MVNLRFSWNCILYKRTAVSSTGCEIEFVRPQDTELWRRYDVIGGSQPQDTTSSKCNKNLSLKCSIEWCANTLTNSLCKHTTYWNFKAMRNEIHLVHLDTSSVKILWTLQSRVLASFFASMLSYESKRKNFNFFFEIRLEAFF